MRVLLLIAYVFLCGNIIAQETAKEENVLIVSSTKDILQASNQTTYIFIEVYEKDSLISNLQLLENLHYEKLYYTGNLRAKFPEFKKKVNELKTISLIGTNLQNLPSFINSDSIVHLVVETFQNIEFELSKYENIQSLAISSKNSYLYIKKICNLKKLEALDITGSVKKIKSFECLKHINGLGADFSKTNIKQLYKLDKLRTLIFYNEITYKDVLKHLNYFKTLEKVSFNFKGTDEELIKIKSMLKNVVTF